MRAFIRNAIEDQRARREETGEKGFSLVELIIVVLILGVLAAVAIPIFVGIQDEAKQNAASTVAANAASQAAVQIAQGKTVDVTNFVGGKATAVTASGATLENICVSATVDGVTRAAGPGANADGTACGA